MSDPTSTPQDPLTRDRLTDLFGRAPFDPEPDELEIGELFNYWRVLYRRRWLMASVFVIVTLSVVVYTFTAIPIYRASSQILIESGEQRVVSFEEVLQQNQSSNDYYQTQYQILESRALARRTLDNLGLWDHPAFRSGDSNHESASLRTRFLDLVGLGQDSEVVGTAASREATAGGDLGQLREESVAESRAIDAFVGGLTVEPVRNSRLVNLHYRSPDPVLAARLANGLAASYIEQDLELKLRSSQNATSWLAQQLQAQRAEVERAEQALQHYREENDALSLEDRQNIVVQRLADLNAAVTQANRDVIDKQAAYNQLRELRDDPAALDTFPAIVSNSYIQQQKLELASVRRQRAQMADRLGPKHPDMVELDLGAAATESRIDAEIDNVVQSIRNEYRQALDRQRDLTATLARQKAEALELNRKGIEYGALARDAAANRSLFESLMQRMKETGVSGELETSNIRVVDEAEVPRGPVSPNVRMNLLLALFGGLFSAVGVAIGFELLDSRVKTADDIKRHLELPFLGMIPILTDHTDPASTGRFSESFRTVRTNLLFSLTDGSKQSLVVTSAAPSEGKTFVASHIATVLAQAGERVLLVDADLRRSRVHEVFQRRRVPGLSNVLVGEAKVSEAIQQTAVPGLSIMSAGVSPPNPAELLGSKRFQALVQSLQQYFTWVVFDTPPLMAVTDAVIVANRATGVAFVVGADQTNRRVAQQAVEQLRQCHARVFGAVLNMVDIQHHAYYYQPYYSRQASQYYER